MKLRTPVVAAVVGIGLTAGAVRAFVHSPAPHADFEVAAPASPPEESRPRPRETPPPGPPRIVVYVAGAVVRPGLYRLPPAARTADAVRAAGGLKPEADPVAVNLAAPLSDGDEVAVPRNGDPGDAAPRASGAVGAGARARHGARGRRKHRSRHRRPAASGSGAAEPASGAGAAEPASGAGAAEPASGAGAAAPAPAAPQDDVDLNTAGPDELASLPGVGPAMAERIIEFREQNGPFTSIDDLLDVGGMSEGKLDELAPYVTLR